jgi:hypothetical protein
LVVFQVGPSIGEMLVSFLHHQKREYFMAIYPLQFGSDVLRG